MAGESLKLSGKHTENNKYISVTHTKWQLNEVQLQALKRRRRSKSEASWDKNSFSRIIDLTGSMLVVNCTIL